MSAGLLLAELGTPCTMPHGSALDDVRHSVWAVVVAVSCGVLPEVVANFETEETVSFWTNFEKALAVSYEVGFVISPAVF